MICPLECAEPGSGTMCAECGSELVAERPAPTPPPADLLVRFEFGDIAPRAGAPVPLGRDPDWSSHAGALEPYTNVSRKHATVGMDADGAIWIDPEKTPNGTFRNGEELPPNARHPLAQGDRVRLAAKLEGVVTR
ncbi:FHA domain-containing protein [Streptosporangiaceae bacterium NEAU-GS5]|nr:FHA domain-containing protein [Streptosporangiaceae bacterium NEAU-GS5]